MSANGETTKNKFVWRRFIVIASIVAGLNIVLITRQTNHKSLNYNFIPNVSTLENYESDTGEQIVKYPGEILMEMDDREKEHLPNNEDENNNEIELEIDPTDYNIKTDLVPSPKSKPNVNNANIFKINSNFNESYQSHTTKTNTIQSPKKILVWNSYWKSKAIWHKIFSEIIHGKCPESNCVLTTDQFEIDSSDAVIIHLLDLAEENYTIPLTRKEEQIWIAMTYEPPYIMKFSGLNFTKLNGLFNRTMSYRRDSDIITPHGSFSKYSPAPFPNYMSDWFNSHDPISIRNYAEGKKRLVAWFASSRSCESQSGREIYVKELQEHLTVDVYGACGPYKCGVQKTMRNPYKVEEDDCYHLVSVGYKFVLAFENSICRDYVTEKLYNNLKLNVVPVVFGGGNYSTLAPPNSYIDAGKYEPKGLAKLLLYLDKNDTAFNEYFSWKREYYIKAHDGTLLVCDLCEKMNRPEWKTERKVYNEIDIWLDEGCQSGYHTNK